MIPSVDDYVNEMVRNSEFAIRRRYFLGDFFQWIYVRTKEAAFEVADRLEALGFHLCDESVQENRTGTNKECSHIVGVIVRLPVSVHANKKKLWCINGKEPRTTDVLASRIEHWVRGRERQVRLKQLLREKFGAEKK